MSLMGRQWNLFEAFAWALSQQMPGSVKLTLLVLVHEAVHEAGGDFVARITQHDLARLTCASRKTMIMHLAELERRRLVEKMGITGEQAGLEYRLISPSDLSRKVTGTCVERLQVPVTKGDRSTFHYNERARESYSGLNSSLPLPSFEEKKEGANKSIAGARPTVSAAIWRGKLPVAMQQEFDVFYKQKYPRRIYPAKAERAFFFARKIATAQVILDGLDRAIESEEWAYVPKDGGSIIPHPATWLNGRGWENEYTKKTEKGKPLSGIAEFIKQGGAS